MPRESAGAGFIYVSEQHVLEFPPGTGQVNAIVSLPQNRKAALIGASLYADAVATGAGASRTFNVRKGNATGTVVATATVVLADLDTLGEVKDIPVTPVGGAEFLDTDTLSVEWATAGAVAFTAGRFILSLRWRMRLQQRN